MPRESSEPRTLLAMSSVPCLPNQSEAHGTGLLMDVFTPTGKPNGLGIVDIASGAWYSDRNKIRDHMLAQVYTTFCSRGYVVFAVRPGSKTRYTAAEMDHNLKSAIRHVKAHADKDKKGWWSRPGMYFAFPIGNTPWRRQESCMHF